MKNDRVVIGADIGGTHITAARVHEGKALNASSLAHASLRRSIPATASADELLQAWAACLSAAIDGSDVKKICLAMPGPFDYEKGVCLIKNQNKYPGLYGVNVKQRLSVILGLAASDIYLHNDAACFVQGEATYGVACGYNKVLGVTLGTGLGTSVFTSDASWSADLWNMQFKDGIAEDYISSRWFLRQYHQLKGAESKGVKELVALAEADEVILQLFNEFGNNLGAFLRMFLDREPADAIVLGGNISKALPLFVEVLQTQIGTTYPSVKILQSDNGEHAALTGAVASWCSSVKQAVK